MKAGYDGCSFEMRDTVARTGVQYHNRYGITLAGEMYLPRDHAGNPAAIAVAGPFGAVREQTAGLYDETIAAIAEAHGVSSTKNTTGIKEDK